MGQTAGPPWWRGGRVTVGQRKKEEREGKTQFVVWGCGCLQITMMMLNSMNGAVTSITVSKARRNNSSRIVKK